MDALHTHTSDECCSEPLIKALNSGAIGDSLSWLCPKCGLEWRRDLHQIDPGEGMYHWEPYCPVLITTLRHEPGANRNRR